MDESTYHTSHGLGNENAKRNAYTQQSTVPIMTMHATNMAMQTPNMTVQAPMEIEYGSSSKAGMQTLMSRPQMSHYYSSSFPQYSNARTTLHNNGFARTNSRGSQMAQGPMKEPVNHVSVENVQQYSNKDHHQNPQRIDVHTLTAMAQPSKQLSQMEIDARACNAYRLPTATSQPKPSQRVNRAVSSVEGGAAVLSQYPAATKSNVIPPPVQSSGNSRGYVNRGDQDVPISSHIHRDGLLYSKSSAEMEDLQLIYADLKAINSLVSGKPINDDRSMVSVTSECISRMLESVYTSCVGLLEKNARNRFYAENQLSEHENVERLENRYKSLVEVLGTERLRLSRAENEATILRSKLVKRETDILNLESHKTAEELLAISLKQLSFDSIMRDFKIQHSKLKEMYVHEKSQRRLYSQWARHLVLRQGKIGGPSANEDQIVANHTISSPGVENFHFAISRAKHLLVVNRLLNSINIVCAHFQIRKMELKTQPAEMINETEEIEKLILQRLEPSLKRKLEEENAGVAADNDEERKRLEGTVAGLVKLLNKEVLFQRLVGKERENLDLRIKQAHSHSEIQSLKQEIQRLKTENSNGALDASEQNLIDMRVERNTLKSSCEMLEALLNEQIEHAAKQHRVILTSVQKPLRDQLSHLNQEKPERALQEDLKKKDLVIQELERKLAQNDEEIKRLKNNTPRHALSEIKKRAARIKRIASKRQKVAK